jgi:uncharacterized protein (TIGR03437 family)
MRAVLLCVLAGSFLVAATVNYSYDTAGRLVKVDYGNGTVIAYFYDKAGNLTSRQVQASGPIITSVNTAGAGPDIAQNDWIEIKGSNLVPPTTPAGGTDWSNAPELASGQLPAELGGVSVTVNGKAAYVYFYCSAVTSTICASDQIDVLTPLDDTLGQVSVVVTNGTVSIPPFTVNKRAIVPSFLLLSPKGYIAARHADGSLLGPTSLYPGLSTPAQPNEPVMLYGVGFGLPATPIVNGSAAQSGALVPLPVCTVGGTPAPLSFAGLVGPGVYQFNLTVPANAASGDNPIACTYNGAATPSGDLLAVQ